MRRDRTNVAVMMAVAGLALAGRASAQDEPAESPALLACDADLACPPPLACDSEAEGGPFCTWQVIECATADDCPTSFECTEASRYEGCVACTEGADGEQCEPAPCEGPSTCEPEQIGCADDADCPAEWSCVTLLDYPTPAYWEAAEGEIGCVPNGAIALGDGSVAFTTLEASATGGPVPEAGAESMDPTSDGAPEADGVGADEMSPTSKPGAMGDVCSVGAVGTREAGASAALLLLALGWFVGRRRIAVGAR